MSRSSSIDHEDHDADFASLPTRTQRSIDRAFDSVRRDARADGDRPRKRRRLFDASAASTPVESELAGGFLVEEPAPGGFIPDEPAAGGFIVDDSAGGFILDESTQGGFSADEDAVDTGRLAGEGNVRIPLSLIPSALQLLDLPPDDEDTLSVFRNAASGWESRGRQITVQGVPGEQYVSRRDWRAVCAVLLEGREGEHSGGDDTEEGDLAGLNEEDDTASEDEYMASDPESDLTPAGSDSDEYREGSTNPSAKGKRTPANRGKGRRRAGTSEDDELAQPREITARQREECLHAFALFFPDVRDTDLAAQRIKIKDISRVAKLLKENISVEDIVDMLEAFSTARDKSMGLRDFEQMMLAARLA